MLFVRGERATLYSALVAKRNVKRDLCGVTIFKNVTFGKIYVTNVKALYLLKEYLCTRNRISTERIGTIKRYVNLNIHFLSN
jgi:hypothetical protein